MGTKNYQENGWKTETESANIIRVYLYHELIDKAKVIKYVKGNESSLDDFSAKHTPCVPLYVWVLGWLTFLKPLIFLLELAFFISTGWRSNILIYNVED